MLDVEDDGRLFGDRSADTGETNAPVDHLVGEDVIDGRRQVTVGHRDGAVRTSAAPTGVGPLEPFVFGRLEQRFPWLDRQLAVVGFLEVRVSSLREEILVLEAPAVVIENLVVEVLDPRTRLLAGCITVRFRSLAGSQIVAVDGVGPPGQ